MITYCSNNISTSHYYYKTNNYLQNGKENQSEKAMIRKSIQIHVYVAETIERLSVKKFFKIIT